MGKRTYSDEEKADALLQLAANGNNFYRTARETGIPRATLKLWQSGAVHPDVSHICQGKREPLAERLEALAHKCLDILPGKIDTATASQIAFTLGMSVEKMRLLREQSTANVRNDNLTDGERVDRITALAQRARTRRTGQLDPTDQPAIH